MTGPGKIHRLSTAALILLAAVIVSSHGRADWLDSNEGADPWDRCAECHGLDGAGNRIKFPRLAGQEPHYIIKQLQDFRHGRRTNDGGQMQKTATEVKEADIPRVAKWFAAKPRPGPSRPSTPKSISPAPARLRSKAPAA